MQQNVKYKELFRLHFASGPRFGELAGLFIEDIDSYGTVQVLDVKWSPREWASSSAGRAPRSQRGGRRFDPGLVHQILNKHAGIYTYEKLVGFDSAPGLQVHFWCIFAVVTLGHFHCRYLASGV